MFLYAFFRPLPVSPNRTYYINLQKKAQRIRDMPRSASHEQGEKQTYLVAPSSEEADQAARLLAPYFRIVLTSGKKIGQLLVKKKS